MVVLLGIVWLNAPPISGASEGEESITSPTPPPQGAVDMTREALATTSLQSQIGTYTRALNGSDAAANDGTCDYRTSEVADSTFTTVTL